MQGTKGWRKFCSNSSPWAGGGDRERQEREGLSKPFTGQREAGSITLPVSANGHCLIGKQVAGVQFQQPSCSLGCCWFNKAYD